MREKEGKSEWANLFLAFSPFRCPAPSCPRFYDLLHPLNVYTLSHGSVNIGEGKNLIIEDQPGQCSATFLMKRRTATSEPSHPSTSPTRTMPVSSTASATLDTRRADK